MNSETKAVLIHRVSFTLHYPVAFLKDTIAPFDLIVEACNLHLISNNLKRKPPFYRKRTALKILTQGLSFLYSVFLYSFQLSKTVFAKLNLYSVIQIICFRVYITNCIIFSCIYFQNICLLIIRKLFFRFCLQRLSISYYIMTLKDQT